MVLSSLKFRYTLDGAEEAVKAFLQQCDAYVVIRHAADHEVTRDHWHAWVRTRQSVANFRAQFKKACPTVQSSEYSIGVVKDGEDEVYVRYMCHGSFKGDQVNVVAVHSLEYTQDRLQEMHLEFWKNREEFVEKMKTKKKEKKLNTVEELIEYVKMENIEMSDRKAVTYACIDMFKKQKRAMSLYYMESVINTVVSHTPQGRSAIAEKLMEKWNF